jgi:hypothetical protein
MKTEQILITPSMANKMLEMNTINRHLREHYVRALAMEMLEGRWIENTGIPILLNGDGTIIDGQHRLNAVVLANKAMRFTVTSGIQKDVIEVVDTQLPRKMADLFSMSGIKNYALVSSIISFNFYNASNVGKGANVKESLNNKRSLEIYHSDPSFWDNMAELGSKYSKMFRPLSGTWFGGLISLALQESKYPAKVNDFFNQLADGKNCHESVFILRKKLINNQVDNRKLSKSAKRDLVQSYCNAFIKDQKNPYLHPEKIWL